MWTHDQVTDTDRLVEAVSPVLEDPWVQSALVARITREVLTYVDVQQIANEAVDALDGGAGDGESCGTTDLTRPG